ncbi:MAG: hypothetical protein A2Y15_00885 [Clostridiales bacterium GWF2_36_10]|nr:MAG: hypothetical protein A2Y15_00885 [Clostridiales bacterium GWF2_36_10]
MPQNIDSLSGKCIYVAFISTPTRVGRTIRYVTKNTYSHVAISFDESLKRMYSFARYCVNSPLVGGFVEESALRYYCFKQTEIPVKIYKIPLSDEKYKEVLDYISDFEKNSAQYVYNFLALAIAPLHKKLKISKSFTCLEFVYSVLYNCGIETSIDIKRYFTILDLEKALEKYTVYCGNLKKPDDTDWGNDVFYNRTSVTKVVTGSLKRCGVLIKRTFIS